MTDYISRDAALNEHYSIRIDGEVFDVVQVETLLGLPSVDVPPVRETAEWVYGEKDGADGWYCSKCGFHIPWYYDYYGLNNIDFIRDFRTCPHCDAKMLKYTGMKGEWNDGLHRKASGVELF